jgi:hypothetical protein
MRKLSVVLASTPYIDVSDESPAGSSDSTTRLTRRNGRTYEINVNERFGYVGVSEVVLDGDGEERYLPCHFAQGGEAYDLVNERTGDFYSPAYIVRILDSDGALTA